MGTPTLEAPSTLQPSPGPDRLADNAVPEGRLPNRSSHLPAPGYRRESGGHVQRPTGVSGLLLTGNRETGPSPASGGKSSGAFDPNECVEGRGDIVGSEGAESPSIGRSRRTEKAIPRSTTPPSASVPAPRARLPPCNASAGPASNNPGNKSGRRGPTPNPGAASPRGERTVRDSRSSNRKRREAFGFALCRRPIAPFEPVAIASTPVQRHLLTSPANPG